MDYTSSGGHPLQITRSDFSFVAFEIFMVEATLKHVSDSLESSVRVIWESCG